MSTSENYNNGILQYIEPLPGYSEEEICSLPDPLPLELEFWRGGERFKAIKLYMKRNELEDKQELVVWFFLSMTWIASQFLRNIHKDNLLDV